MTPQSPKTQRTERPVRDPRCGPVPDMAWARDAETRRTTGRVEVLNATRPGGLDGWTMDADQYQAVHDLILDIIDADADADGTVGLQHVVDTIQHRLGASELFPKGRLTNYVRYTKTDMEARCEIERIPGSSPQRITRWRTTL
ncbi:MAG TPA: hypothetical protein VES40_04555 [Ilumatobacteraceae bacterium]|nr:hypothetical protein [Ilumatobacteraceae bacterium]